ncbi:MAG: HIT domain-containing protein [Phycisphaerae bacterium]|nr:HIT domain-containing protein [Phycisphaerae bacterium]
MSKWNDAPMWKGLCDGTLCPICTRGHPLDLIDTLPSSWLTIPEKAPMPGYACLVSRIHAVELHDLDETQAIGFILDARRVARAVTAATRAVKLNYEIHGNTLPHLHMHIFPRHRGDRFEGRPIDPRDIREPAYGPGELNAYRAAIRTHLQNPNALD